MTVKTSNGNITASKTLLCEIQNLMFAEARRNRNDGYEATARRYSKMANEIYDALDATGYYDNAKERLKNDLAC